jgi:hypothetical protein
VLRNSASVAVLRYQGVDEHCILQLAHFFAGREEAVMLLQAPFSMGFMWSNYSERSGVLSLSTRKAL